MTLYLDDYCQCINGNLEYFQTYIYNTFLYATEDDYHTKFIAQIIYKLCQKNINCLDILKKYNKIFPDDIIDIYDLLNKKILNYKYKKCNDVMTILKNKYIKDTLPLTLIYEHKNTGCSISTLTMATITKKYLPRFMCGNMHIPIFIKNYINTINNLIQCFPNCLYISIINEYQLQYLPIFKFNKIHKYIWN